jgi:hypothetical protein
MSKQVQQEPTELRAFNYDTIAAPIDGLLFNVDRDLQRRIANHHAAGERVKARSVEMTLMFLRYAKIAYNAVRFLSADTPPDPARKPVYAVIIPNVNRQLIDILSTLVFMLDDLVPRHNWYERSGYRGMREQYTLYSKAYGSDPVWQAHLKSLAAAIVNAATTLDISPEDQQDPDRIKYWPTPNQINKKIKTKSQDFLRYLITWLWGDTSEQAHFACNGMFTLAPYIYGDLFHEGAELAGAGLGWRSLRSALASIWRMRSRVTAKDWPTSSRVCSLPSSRPKRILMTFSSRGVSVRRTCEVWSLRLTLMTASAGETTPRSSMKSPRCESSSSPMGVSREMGSCAILRTLRTLATGMSMRLAISSRWARGRVPAQAAAGADELVDGLDHVHRDADGAGLVGDGAGDGLANPPGGVGGEFVAAAVFEFVDGLHQADVAFLDQVEELQAAVGVFFGDGDDEAEVGLDELALGLLGVHVALR